MPVVKDSPLILDSTGKPANGQLRVRMSAAFDAPAGHVTTAQATISVTDGVARNAGEPWSIPSTPEGVLVQIDQDLDGAQVVRYRTIVPDQAEVTYSELLYNRGGAGGAAYAFWWDLTGGLDFPEGAVAGDFGIDTETGQYWRYEP